MSQRRYQTHFLNFLFNLFCPLNGTFGVKKKRKIACEKTILTTHQPSNSLLVIYFVVVPLTPKRQNDTQSCKNTPILKYGVQKKKKKVECRLLAGDTSGCETTEVLEARITQTDILFPVVNRVFFFFFFFVLRTFDNYLCESKADFFRLVPPAVVGRSATITKSH